MSYEPILFFIQARDIVAGSVGVLVISHLVSRSPRRQHGILPGARERIMRKSGPTAYCTGCVSITHAVAGHWNGASSVLFALFFCPHWREKHKQGYSGTDTPKRTIDKLCERAPTHGKKRASHPAKHHLEKPKIRCKILLDHHMHMLYDFLENPFSIFRSPCYLPRWRRWAETVST